MKNVSIALPRPESLYQKILGCWVGKNCGGTLGAPLEKAYSEEAPFDVSFYPQIQPGGIPNDDLEIQLIWLKALEEVGLDVTARDLAGYWLDHVGYNFDEFGLMKTNLRLGLLPPVSGFYNNFFKHSMGCPIRTEIWACIAPGNPRLAAHYAYEDSICDHGGGESINGSLFNVAVESSAFVVDDRLKLIDIGLSYVPENSLTARCIRVAVESHHAGIDWLEARRRVLEIGGSINAQFSPPNIAFQIIGWLYGAHFGDALCKAVNCGYDTDCTGATLGAILGILGGEKSIPEEWKAPLGEEIATSEKTGGVKNFTGTSNPMPQTITELTDRVLRIQEKVLAKFGAPSADGDSLYADEDIRRKATLPPTRVSFALSAKLDLEVDYGGSPQIEALGTKDILIEFKHGMLEFVDASISVIVPDGWKCQPSSIEGVLQPDRSWSASVKLQAPNRSLLRNRNEIILHLSAKDRPTVLAGSLSIVGAPVYLRSVNYAAELPSTAVQLLEQCFEPENLLGDLTGREARGNAWAVVNAEGNDVGVCLPNFSRGVVYLRRFLKSACARAIWLHTNSTVPGKVWVNGLLAFESPLSRHLRPAAWGSPEGGLHGEISLREGWNELLFKFASDAGCPPFQCHVICSDHHRLYEGVTDLGWTCFPWDEGTSDAS